MLVSLALLIGLCYPSARTWDERGDQSLIQEQLSYSMRYGSFHAGEFNTEVLRTSEGRITLKATMRTPALYRRFFWADNSYLSEVDTALVPRRVVKKIRQKNIAHTIEYVFDPLKGTAKTTDGREWPAPQETRDILSLVYHLRTRPLARGEKRVYVLDGEGLTWRVTAENLGPEKVDVPAGKYTAHKILLRTVGATSPGWRAWKTDILTNRLAGATSGLFIWISTSEGRVPVQMVFPSSPFDLRMTLERSSGTSLPGEGR